MWPTAILQPNGTTYNSVTTFYVVANVGVILFMFLLGCELDQRLLSRQWKKSAPIALSAIMFPFGVGCAASLWLEVRGAACGGVACGGVPVHEPLWQAALLSLCLCVRAASKHSAYMAMQLHQPARRSMHSA